MMFEIDLYNEEVLRAFHEKKGQETLIHLQRATRADLMKECLLRLENGELKNDMPVLAKIFNCEGNVESIKTAIKKATADKFRPIQDFIREKTNKPTDNIIALLAIFIDYQPRPFEQWRENRRAKSEGEEVVILEENDTAEVREETTSPASALNISINNPQNASLPKKKKRELLFGGIGVLTIILLITWYILAFPEECMCWNGENYVQVDCQDKTQPYPVIGLNRDKLEHFRKITKPDTLGIKDIGNIWYSKIDNEVEFFTGPGRHPVMQHKSLKAVTKHIWDTYVNIKPDSNQDIQFGIIHRSKEKSR
ncbi:hypothetical protein K7A41_02970 [Sphingobacterium sp. InxBP1]|uniref:hypothetical protein n=1 Tax=Sphingobacterium sp. InxBP1 TaxID=2870328 RepID=UPI002243FB61|nr:hypothetical protein [Sphingobacterium sp. InxBP1]MCW8310180.1 hypothetical protein [Sphingobacterium sp. InxBP1]